MRTSMNLFRPTYETTAAIGWGSASILSLLMVGWSTPSAIASLVAMLACTYRLRGAIKRWKVLARLSTQYLRVITPDRMMEIAKQSQKLNAFWVGKGWAWEPSHTQLTFDIGRSDSGELEGKAPPFIRKLMRPVDTITNNEPIGASWIHGLGEEKDLMFPIASMPGHTLIVGTTRSGKTRLYQVLTSQAIHLSGTTIIIDPKWDIDLYESVKREAGRAGRPLLLLHPAFPTKSIRISPIQNWNNPTEIASRVVLPLAADGQNNFVDFAWMTVNTIVNGMLMIGERPTLARIRYWVGVGVGGLLEQCFEMVFRNSFGPDWRAMRAPYTERALSDAHATAALYDAVIERGELVRNDSVQKLVETLRHDKEHFGKMILALTPLLDKLCSGELGGLLSPDASDINDKREIWDMSQIVHGRAVLYIALNSLADPVVGSAIGSMLLADLASVAGDAYNFGKPKHDVFVFVDESAEVVNEQFVQILNKSGGANFKCFFATQTLADFEAKMGKKPQSLQLLGNANNLIVLRVQDMETAEYLSTKFGETTVSIEDQSFSGGSQSSAAFIEFRGQVQRSRKSQAAPVITPTLLTLIPNLQFFSRWAGGKIYKGQLPLIIG